MFITHGKTDKISTFLNLLWNPIFAVICDKFVAPVVLIGNLISKKMPTFNHATLPSAI